MTHGSCLQVGEAVLRLQVLKALDHTYTAVPDIPPQESFIPEQPVYPMPDAPVPYDYPGMLPRTAEPPMAAVQPDMQAPYCPPAMPAASPMQPPYCTPVDAPEAPAPVSPSPVQPPRRSDRWKEDWGE